MERNAEHPKRLSEAEVLDRLRSLVGYGRTQASLAAELNVSAAFVSSVLKGDKRAPEPFLALAGIERRVEFYEK